MKAKFTKVVGISDVRRLPRLGKIRLGVKVRRKDVKSCDCASGCYKCSYPTETKHFVCPPEVEKIYGREPTELDVMFPVDDPEVVFPQAYKFYGASRGVKCMGDGETALRVNEETGEMEEISCPTPEKCNYCKNKAGNPQCSFRAHLMVILPKVSVGGVYQIDTGSYNSAVDVNSGFDYIRALVGRINIPHLKLRRVPRETIHEGSRRTHYTLTLTLDMDIGMIEAFRQDNNRITYALPEPEDIRPDLEGEVVELREEGEEPTAQEGAGDVWDRMGPDGSPKITDRQHKKLRARLTEAGVEHNDFRQWVFESGGINGGLSMKNISKKWADRMDSRAGWEAALTAYGAWKASNPPQDALDAPDVTDDTPEGKKAVEGDSGAPDVYVTKEEREGRAVRYSGDIEKARHRRVVCPEDGEKKGGHQCIDDCDAVAYMECKKWEK